MMAKLSVLESCQPDHIVRPGLTEAGWRDIGQQLRHERAHSERTGSRLMWDVGDWLIDGEDVVFTMLKRARVRELASEITGYSRHTLRMAASVARKVPPAARRPNLSWWHHLVVAKLSSPEQRLWLARAAEEGWSANTAREELLIAGLVSGHPRRRRPGAVVSHLLTLTKADMSQAMLEDIEAWWQQISGQTASPDRAAEQAQNG
jgi:hypothetical protein